RSGSRPGAAYPAGAATPEDAAVVGAARAAGGVASSRFCRRGHSRRRVARRAGRSVGRCRNGHDGPTNGGEPEREESGGAGDTGFDHVSSFSRSGQLALVDQTAQEGQPLDGVPLLAAFRTSGSRRFTSSTSLALTAATNESISPS